MRSKREKRGEGVHQNLSFAQREDGEGRAMPSYCCLLRSILLSWLGNKAILLTLHLRDVSKLISTGWSILTVISNLKKNLSIGKSKMVFPFTTYMVKFHEDAYWQKVMSLFHGQSKLSPDLNIYRNCMGFFLLLEFKLLVDNWIKNRPEGVPKVRIIFLLLVIIHEENP